MPERFPTIFYDGQVAARRHVEVSMDAEGLTISQVDGDQSTFWPYADLTIASSYMQDRGAQLSHRGLPDARLQIPDKTVFEVIRKHIPAEERIGRKLKFGAQVVIFLIAVGVTLLILLPLASQFLVRYLPPEYEARLGNMAYHQFFANAPVCTSKKAEESFRKITAALVPPDTPWEYRITVIDRSMNNALALPGGRIILFRGLIDFTESQEELIGVIAHEMAHVEARHGTQNIIKSMFISILMQALTGEGDLLTFLLQSYQSREAEAEADRMALPMLERAQVDPAGFARFFERMQQREVSLLDQKLLSYLSTHPASDTRIRIIEQHSKTEDMDPLLSSTEWRAIQRSCGE